MVGIDNNKFVTNHYTPRYRWKTGKAHGHLEGRGCTGGDEENCVTVRC